MRKTILTILFALACISSAWARQDTIKVSTAKDLSDALKNNADNSNAVIQLMADIDMAQYEDFSPLDHYNGSLTGYYEDTEGGETITTYRVIKNLKTNLVDDMTGAKVSGIMFRDGERGNKFYGGLNACFLCEDAKDCDFTDIILVNCHYNDSSFGGDWYASETGLITNKMDNCKVTRVAVLCSSLCSDGSEIGGITGVATNGCTFTECFVDGYTSIYTTKEPNAFVGGLVGKSEDCKFLSCMNRGIVSASPMSDNLGGISGYSTKCTFTDCYNSGTVSQLTPTACDEIRAKSKGFFALYLATVSYLPLVSKKWYNTVQNNIEEEFSRNVDFIPENMAAEAKYGWGTVAMTVLAVAMTAYEISMKIYNANAPDEVGGITSAAYACTFDRCTNAGFIACRDAFCGGIVGYADTKGGTITKINNCINIGYIQGNEQTGGIVGYLQDSHATNCFNAGAVDCLKSTNGPIYGDTNAKGATITTCFAMEHGASYGGNAVGGEGVIVKFSEKDVVGGRAAYEMNRIIGKDIFRQTVGEDRCPNFTSDVVYASDIRTELDVTYRVYDADGLCTALMYPYAQIELQDDIDFNNSYISLYRGSCKFHGSIDGKGHTIKNIKTEHTEQNENFDEDNERNAMIQFAEDAIFENLTLDSLTIKRDLYVSGLVGNSKNSFYENVKLAHSEIYSEITFAGGLVYESDHDTFTRCETDLNTNVSTHGIYGSVIGSIFGNIENAYAGGLAGKAKGSTFTDCANWADVSGKMDVVGGVVAYDEGSTFTRCRNYGNISHASWAIPDDDELGGIVAEAKNSEFYECINAGVLYCEDENGGGIVGLGTNVTIINCVNDQKYLNFSKETCGGIIGYAENSMVANCASYADYPCIGESTGMNLASGNNYRVQISNDRSNRWEAAVDEKTMKSGLVCLWLNNGYENRSEGKMVWYQNLKELPKDDVPYPTSDGHPEVLITDLPHDVITSADQFVAFAKKVNGGDNYACAVLDADIDLSTVGDWTPIGNHENRFQGVFDGQGHTIHGMKVNINSDDVGAGLFGVTHMNAEIRNVIIGDDCEVNNSGEAGAGGIVGAYKGNMTWGSVLIRNCGSSANVTAPKHAAGIFGRFIPTKIDGNYDDAIKINIINCYNTGTVTATTDGNSGLIGGYMRNSAVVKNCWSVGKLLSSKEGVKPYDTQHNEFFVGYMDKVDISDCYALDPDVSVQNATSGLTQNGVTNLSETAVANGELVYEFNKNCGNIVLQQNIGTDPYPVPGDRGLYHTRKVSNQYGTVCLPFTVKSNDKISYYKLIGATEGSEINLKFEYIKEVLAGIPALYRATEVKDVASAESPVEICFNYAGNEYLGFPYEPWQFPDWHMHGTFEKKVFEGDDAKSIYYVSNGEVRNAKKATIAPFRAYIHGPSIGTLTGNSGQAKAIRFILEDENGETTTIESPELDSLPRMEGWGGASYSLMGTEVNSSYRGIVIRNGKKMIQNR